ncbi:pyroglutamylated RFamide peptide receptor-like [Stylophora pistillata]|uniref:pyroglutamylated RFamide peptide receptor-like n=1 Tax=Stylophora pistillata TaxID=50429 RepID=UPI000C051A9A|nr:pyroglutamylated RFamide peptide receptor-like [Stylophora pistillata]
MSLFTYTEPAQIGLRTAFSLIVTVNLIGNASVCLVVWRNRQMRTAMNFLLVNLACADMMVAIFIAPQYIFLHTYKNPNGLTGDYLCKIVTGGNLMWTAGVVSVVSLIGVAFERYFAVLYPHDESRRISKTKLKFIIPACWLFSISWNFPLFLLVKYDASLDFCYEEWPPGWYMNAYSLGWLIIIGILPVTVMSGLYSRVVYQLWVRTSQPVDLPQRAVVKSRKRVTKMVLSVTVLCAVCWLPNLIAYVLDFYGLNSHGDVVHTTTVVLVSLNSAVNPIIYCFQSKDFRRHIKALWLSPCSKRPGATVGTSKDTAALPASRSRATQPF